MAGSYITPMFDFTSNIPGESPGSQHSVQRVMLNNLGPNLFNEYERLFTEISKVIGNYAFSDDLSGFSASNNNIGSAIRFVVKDYKILTENLNTRKFDKQGGVITGNTTINAKLEITNGLTVTNDTLFNGLTTFQNYVTMKSKLTMDAPIVSSSYIEITQNSSFLASLTVAEIISGNVINANTLSISGQTVLGQTQLSELKVTSTTNLIGTVTTGQIVAYDQITSKLTSIAPFIVESSVVVINLNADKVDDYEPGNASGKLAINNNTLCIDLNADKLDGMHAGNSSGNISINNGTLNTNLNAEMLGGLKLSVANAINSIVARDGAGGISCNTLDAITSISTKNISTDNLSAKAIVANNIFIATAKIVAGTKSIDVSIPSPYSSMFADTNQYEVSVTLLTNMSGNAGEIWATKSPYKITVNISGQVPSGSAYFSIIAISKVTV